MSGPGLDAATVTGCPVRRLPNEGTPLDPSPSIAAWRAEAPAVRLSYGDGSTGWFVTRYDLARQVLEDPRLDTEFRPFHEPDPDPVERSAYEGPAREVAEDIREALRDGVLISVHGDRHARLRRAVSGRYSVKASRSHQTAIAGIVRRRLDAFAAGPRRADLVSGFARHVSTDVHALVLGVPDEDVARFAHLFAESPEEHAMFEFLRELLARKRRFPGDDVLTELAHAELSVPEREGLAVTVALTGRDAVSAVGANRDERRYERPDEFDVTRDASGHLGFGHGIHTCLGQQLARVEVIEALTQLVDRFPAMRLVEAASAPPASFLYRHGPVIVDLD